MLMCVYFTQNNEVSEIEKEDRLVIFLPKQTEYKTY